MWFLGEDDELSPDALFEIARLLPSDPEADLLYSDEDSVDERGDRSSPRFKPGLSPDLLLSNDYVGRCGDLPKEPAWGARGPQRRASRRHTATTCCCASRERTDRIVHLPRVLFTGAEEQTAWGARSAEEEGSRREGSRTAFEEALERRGARGYGGGRAGARAPSGRGRG